MNENELMVAPCLEAVSELRRGSRVAVYCVRMVTTSVTSA